MHTVNVYCVSVLTQGLQLHRTELALNSQPLWIISEQPYWLLKSDWPDGVDLLYIMAGLFFFNNGSYNKIIGCILMHWFWHVVYFYSSTNSQGRLSLESYQSKSYLIRNILIKSVRSCFLVLSEHSMAHWLCSRSKQYTEYSNNKKEYKIIQALQRNSFIESIALPQSHSKNCRSNSQTFTFSFHLIRITQIVWVRFSLVSPSSQISWSKKENTFPCQVWRSLWPMAAIALSHSLFSATQNAPH